MFLLVVGLVGVGATVSGTVLLVRTARGHPMGPGADVQNPGTLETLSYTLLGVALVAAGGFLVYFPLWAEGIVP